MEKKEYKSFKKLQFLTFFLPVSPGQTVDKNTDTFKEWVKIILLS